MHEAATTPAWVLLAYLIAGVCFILALRGLSSPESSRRGNRAGMIGMAIAVVTTLVIHAPLGGVSCAHAPCIPYQGDFIEERFFVNRRIASAWLTSLPRIISTTSRAFCAEPRKYFALAVASITQSFTWAVLPQPYSLFRPSFPSGL